MTSPAKDELGPTPGRTKLRLGVLCDRPDSLEEWQLRCLEELLELPGVALCALVVDPVAWGRREVPHLASPTCLARSPLRLESETSVIAWKRGEARAELDAAAPDLLLRFNFDALDPELITQPALGTWCFTHDASARACDAPPFLVELSRGDSIQRASLVRLTGPKSGVLLHEGVLRAVRSSWSLHVDRVYGEVARWPAQLCRAWLAGLPLPESSGERPVAELARPSDAALRGFAARIMGRRLRRSAARRLRKEEWGVGLIKQPLTALLSPEAPRSIEWLEASPAAAFRADPFGLRCGAEAYALFEEWDEVLGRGRIAAAPVDCDGRAGRVLPVFEAPHHLSYPCVFEHAGQLYCMPECSEAGELALYRCTRAPDDWERIATLLTDDPVVDATPLLHEGRWWIWCTDATGDAATRLRLFTADQLTGPWREHPRSPVKTDVRSSRPAGTPFLHEGVLYRPAQDCSEGYGGAAVILRVDALTPTDYAEHCVARVEPDPQGPYPDGLHTLSAFGDWTLVDGKRWAPVGPARWFSRY